MIVPSSSPVPFLIARSMLDAGMLTALAAAIAVRRRGFASRSPPPWRAAMVISLMAFVNVLPRAASVAAFLRLMVAHLDWPDIGVPEHPSGVRPRLLLGLGPGDHLPGELARHLLIVRVLDAVHAPSPRHRPDLRRQ